MNTKLKFLFTLLVVLYTGSICSQEPIDAMMYRLQKRPQRTKLSSEHFFENTFISTGMGMSHIFTTRDFKTNQLGFNAGLYVGKWFSNSSGLRLGIDGMPIKMNINGYERKAGIASFSADYLLNLSNFVYDNNPSRKFDVVALLGLSYLAEYASNNGFKSAYGARVGLQGNWNISPLFSLYLEPRMGVYSDNLDYNDHWSGYDMKGDLLLGFKYKYVDDKNRTNVEPFVRKPFLENTFFSLAAGAEMMIMTDAVNTNNMHNIGPYFSLAAGKWFAPHSGIRLSANAGYSQYHTARYLSHVGGRLDYMLNLNSAFNGYKPHDFFSLNAILGLNADCSENKSGETSYSLGLGVGAQANFTVSNNTDLYIEPRVNVYPTSFGGGLTNDHIDIMTQLAIGVTYNRSSKSVRADNNANFERKDFADNIFVSAGIGGQALLSTQLLNDNVTSQICPRGILSIGKWFTPVHGLRVSGSASFLTVNNSKLRSRDKLIAADIDYLFNLTNAMQGYDEDRLFDISALIGGGLVYRHGKQRDVLPCLTGGLHANFQLTPAWSLFLEPKIQGYRHTLSVHSLGFFSADPIFSLTGGATYRLRNYSKVQNRRLYHENEYGKYFFGMAAGPAMVATPFVFKQQWGVAARATIGKWFSPISAWRTHLRFESVVENSRNSLEYGGLELDYQLSLTNLFDNYRANRLFNLNASIGFSLGASYSDYDLKFVPGGQIGLQAAFRLNNALSLYLEPQGHLYGRNFARVNPSRRNDIIFSTLLGMNYRFAEIDRKNRDYRLDNSSFMNNTFIAAGIGSGAFGTTVFSKSAKVRPTLVSEVSFGKWFNTVSALRFAVSNSNVSMGKKPDPHFNFKTLGLELSYITNWTALLTGAPAPLFNLHSLLGFSMVNGWHQGEHNFVPAGGIGAQANFTINKSLDLYVEPKVNLYSGEIDGLRAPVNLDADAQVIVALKYKF